MKADGQHAADFLRRARDFRHHARGRQRDPTTAERDTLAIHGDLHRVADIFEVIKRLTHAHQHDVGNQTRPFAHAFAGLGPFAQIVARHHHLAHDFTGGQIAHQLLRTGVAERTGQRAAHLAGNAQRAAIFLGDIDHLDLMAAGDPHQIFARPIGRDVAAHHLGHSDHEMLGQFGAVALGEVGHHLEIARAPDIDPLPDLADTHLCLLFGRSGGNQGVAHGIAR